jgi:hypothetical protein
MHPLRLWSGATEQSVEIVTINTATLGDRSYLAHDGQLALVIDPQRDIGRVLAVAASVASGSPTSSRRTYTTTT